MVIIDMFVEVSDFILTSQKYMYSFCTLNLLNFYIVPFLYFIYVILNDSWSE